MVVTVVIVVTIVTIVTVVTVVKGVTKNFFHKKKFHQKVFIFFAKKKFSPKYVFSSNNSKAQIVMKLKKSNCDDSQKLKL